MRKLYMRIIKKSLLVLEYKEVNDTSFIYSLSPELIEVFYPRMMFLLPFFCINPVEYPPLSF